MHEPARSSRLPPRAARGLAALAICALGSASVPLRLAAGEPAGYAILMPRSAARDPAWRAVAEALQRKHGAATPVLEFDWHVAEALPALRAARPRYLACVAPIPAVTRQLGTALNRLCRRLDDDPYGDCLWGFVTGPVPADALRIAAAREPLILRRGLGTTGFDQGWFTDSILFSDGAKGAVEWRTAGGAVQKEQYTETPEGLAFRFRDFWDAQAPQFIVSSSHCTQYNLEMPFGQGLIVAMSGRFHVLRRDQLPGFARFLGGAMFRGNEADLARYVADCRAPLLAASTNAPKIWIGAGNCLLGETRSSTNSMAATALGAGGVHQLVGYTVPTWYGKMGWGTFGRFFASRGRLTCAEAFFFANQTIIQETLMRNAALLGVEFDDRDIESALQAGSAFTEALARAGLTQPEKDDLGLIHDRDTVVFYGDPAWAARLDATRRPDSLAVSVEAVASGIAIRLAAGEGYDGHGFDVLFPRPIAGAAAAGAEGCEFLLTDDFLMVAKTALKAGETRELRIAPGGVAGRAPAGR